MAITSFKDLKSYIASDAYRYTSGRGNLKLYLLNIGFRYSFWMRTCCYLKQSRFLYPLFLFSFLYLRHLSFKSGIQIPYNTDIDKGFYIGHFGTIVVNGKAKIGRNVNISPSVNIGQSNRGKNKGYPTIGDEVYIGPGAKIIGAVHVGNNVAIGANAVVTKDVPDNACVGGIPANIISYDGVEGYIERII